MRAQLNKFLRFLFFFTAVVAAIPSQADPAATQPTKSFAVDSEGRKRYLFVLDWDAARKEDAFGELPAKSPEDQTNSSDIYGWHLPKIRALVKRLEREFNVHARRMTSWAAPSFSAHVTEETLGELRRSPNVRYVVPILKGEIYPSSWNDRIDAGEFVSWGKIAIGADDLSTTSNRVYLLDSIVHDSIDIDTCCPGKNLFYDDNPNNAGHNLDQFSLGYRGHATHIAGILAAKANGYGTRGVNNGAPIVSVNLGEYDLDDVVTAIDWILATTESNGAYAIANMSLNSSNPEVIKRIRVASTRVLFVQSAGNNHQDACNYAYNSPNSADGILVVGGIDNYGQEAIPFLNPGYGNPESGSNYGPCVEVWAPATNILSSYFNPADSIYKTYAYRPMSGTSMAAPHVAALAARFGSTTTTPVEREMYIRSILFATGYFDSTAPVAIPIRVPSLAVQATPIPTRLSVSQSYASHTMLGTSPAYTHDSHYFDWNVWNAGRVAPAWIEYDLGASRTLKSIRLVPEQSPEGEVLHWIFAGDSQYPTTLVGTVAGSSTMLEPISIQINATGRYVRIHTEMSPSWVAWREVEIYGY